MEKAKTQEIAKLQSALQEMQIQFEETKEMQVKEYDGTKAFVNKKKIDEIENKFEGTSKVSEERLKQALEAESNIVQLKTAMHRLQEKFSDIEIENQLLRQQTLQHSFVVKTSNCLLTPRTQSSKNGHIINEDNRDKDLQSATSPKTFGKESDIKIRRFYTEQQHESIDALINCVVNNVGFSHGKPIAAFTIYKCLLHWKSFEVERTSVFDRLIQMIGSEIKNEDNNYHMAYWLSNTSALLSLLQQILKDGSSDGATSRKKTPSVTSLFGKMTMSFRSSTSSNNHAAATALVVHRVEAKYPALLFIQQLALYVEKIYRIIQDNLKKEVTSFLSLCIQAPRTSKGSALRSSHSFGKDLPITHWQSIIDTLNSLLSTLKQNFVPLILIQNIFTQIFSYMNVQLFNSLLLQRECCTFSNGEYIKFGLTQLEQWCHQANEKYAGSSWDKLKHIRQAVGLLVIHKKHRISYEEITNDLCPILSVQQLYRICTMYWDGNYNTRSVSPDVIANMRVLMIEDSNNTASDSLLLKDDSSIPFSAEDLSNSLQVKDFEDVELVEELLKNPAFQFLHE